MNTGPLDLFFIPASGNTILRNEIFFVGEHPRLGALDVCPFIPVQGVTMEECVECAKEFGERLAMELGVPGIKIMQ